MVGSPSHSAQENGDAAPKQRFDAIERPRGRSSAHSRKAQLLSREKAGVPLEEREIWAMGVDKGKIWTTGGKNKGEGEQKEGNEGRDLCHETE